MTPLTTIGKLKLSNQIKRLWKCHFLSVQWVKFLRFFLWKHLLEMFKYYYIYYNLFVTGAWGSWRWGAEGEDYVFSDVKSFCFCSSNFETDLKHLFWKCLTFWSGFVANVEFMTFVLILIEVWIWERDNVSFYANGHKDPKKRDSLKKWYCKKVIFGGLWRFSAPYKSIRVKLS